MKETTGRIHPDDMKKLLGWRIYYSDGTTVDSEEMTWEEAPSEGVQVLVGFMHKPYRSMVCGFDLYKMPPEKDIKRGALLDDESYYAIQRRAQADESWPGE